MLEPKQNKTPIDWRPVYFACFFFLKLLEMKLVLY